MILYRPVSLQELELMYEGGMQAFPTRLPQQPIYYPVLQLEYARQIASDWNANNGAFAGYVTEFKVEDQYIGKFEKHTVGAPQDASQYQEFWIPSEEMEEFNRHVMGHIKVLEAYFGDGFQGFVPEKFGLQGKNAVAQFTLLANSFVYKRMDFYLEIRRNHKAVFLNYPFWQKYEFKNEGLKEKVIQAIKEAWITSFPNIPLPSPPPAKEDPPSVKQIHAEARRLADTVQEDDTPVGQTDTQVDSQFNPEPEDEEDITLLNQTYAHTHRLAAAAQEDIEQVEQTDAQADSLDNPEHEDARTIEEAESEYLVDADDADSSLAGQTDADAHFAQGLELGLRGEYQEAVAELSKTVEDDPHNIIAQTSLGVALHRLGEEARALSCYEDALSLDPTYAEAHYFRANILYGQGKMREAIAAYTLAIGLKPELIEAHHNPPPQDRLTDYSPAPAEMVWIAKPAHRILNVNQSLKSDPGQAHLFKERAADYYRLRNYVQTIADYSSYLAIRPDDASAFHFRGLAYEQIEQFDRALEDFQRAITIDPQLVDGYINRGVTFGKMGQVRQAIASLTEAIRLAPKNPDGYFNRGATYLQGGDLERSIDDFSKVIQLSPGDAEAYYWRGISYEEAGHQPEAIADFRQFLALSQNSPARAELEEKLRRWNASEPETVSSSRVPEDEVQKTEQVQLEKPDRDLDLYDLILALGERALHSTWFGTGADCSGERAEELYAFTDQDKPIDGRDFLQITSGIRQTIEGDFQAFDPGAADPWIFIRAWHGDGFYIETDDPEIKERLQAHFQEVDEVEGASPPYESLFIASDAASK